MHILFLTHYFPPEGNAPASRVSALTRRWVALGYQVTVITCVPNVPNGVPYAGFRNRLLQREEYFGVQVLRVWTYLAPNKGAGRRTLNYLSFMISGFLAGLACRKVDIVVATSPQFFCGWAGALLGVVRRLPFLLEIRDIWPESIEAVGALSNRIVLRYLSWLERRLYLGASHIVTVGESYRSKLLERLVPADKISVIPNGVDRDLFTPRPPSESIRERYGLNGAFVCSYIGTVGMASGLEVVLRAAEKLQTRSQANVRFLIVGDGAALRELRQAAADRGIRNVVFTGLQPKESIADFLAASDACLVHLKKQPIFRTVMPSKIFEALALGRPVILGVQGFAEKFINGSGGGICIEPENEDALISAIARFQADPALGARMGERGRAFVMKHYDRERLADDYLLALQRTVRLGPAPWRVKRQFTPAGDGQSPLSSAGDSPLPQPRIGEGRLQ
jgi:glycosyltransferase involved in cell wall biosynthesis